MKENLKRSDPGSDKTQLSMNKKIKFELTLLFLSGKERIACLVNTSPTTVYQVNAQLKFKLTFSLSIPNWVD